MLINTLDLGLIEFNKAYDLQKKLLNDIHTKQASSTLIICEHYPVITCGRKANPSNILVNRDILKSKGIQVIDTNRGGDVTYHGPGQLIIYPIINLNNFIKDITIYLRLLELTCIDFLSYFDIKSRHNQNSRGVWIRNEKIASIGIGISKWITYHGLSINLNTDLNHFSFIKPCGQNIKMTSVQKILNKTIDIKKSKLIIIDKFYRCFKRIKSTKINETYNLTNTR